MTSAVSLLITFIVLTIFFSCLWFQRDVNSKYDLPLGKVFYPALDSKTRIDNARALKKIYQQISSASTSRESSPVKTRIDHLREFMDGLRAHVPIISSVDSVDAGGVPSEWVVAPNADSSRRLLYIHGGGFMAGSPVSHRVITSKLSEVTRCAVLAIDYRLSPEHKRNACIDDCRTAYDWLLDNGPCESSVASSVYVAGDSAGGNLTLSLLAWVRDTKRRAPNAAVALSPVTDMRMVNPSVKFNVDTDIMLKPLAKKLIKVPRWLLIIMGRFMVPYDATDPSISPLLGRLHDLAPLLIQVSDSEILLDDGRRYANKARAAGSRVTLQIWSGMPHVWQFFYPDLSAAEHAFNEIDRFISLH
ncbi:MAG: alpha/beta hydrolase [Porticoccaceae bacterium]|nr:alpha/beta hydrolase [Porticoccaceae bacterium]